MQGVGGSVHLRQVARDRDVQATTSLPADLTCLDRSAQWSVSVSGESGYVGGAAAKNSMAMLGLPHPASQEAPSSVELRWQFR
jgi:hypothetical protein